MVVKKDTTEKPHKPTQEELMDLFRQHEPPDELSENELGFFTGCLNAILIEISLVIIIWVVFFL